MMKSITDKEVTPLNNRVWKINTPVSDTYRALVGQLKADGVQWYTYEDKKQKAH